MRIIEAYQSSFDTIFDFNCDLFIASSGFELRAPYFSKLYLSKKSVKEKIVFCYQDREVLKRRENLERFRELGFQEVNSFGSSSVEVCDYLSRFIGLHEASLRIIVDYSSMTKVWYGCILDFFCRLKRSGEVIVSFVYTPSAFEKPCDPMPNSYIDILPGFSSLSSPDARSLLILCLGYERIRAEGLIEVLDLDKESIYVFYTSDDYSGQFSRAVLDSNSQVLKGIEIDRIIPFDLSDLETLQASLSTLASRLMLDGKVNIAPLGPKPFSLVSMLIAKRQKRINIFRVGAGERAVPAERKPDTTKDPIIYNVRFED